MPRKSTVRSPDRLRVICTAVSSTVTRRTVARRKARDLRGLPRPEILPDLGAGEPRGACGCIIRRQCELIQQLAPRGQPRLQPPSDVLLNFQRRNPTDPPLLLRLLLKDRL